VLPAKIESETTMAATCLLSQTPKLGFEPGFVRNFFRSRERDKDVG
jgi:hypothetical protein